MPTMPGLTSHSVWYHCPLKNLPTSSQVCIANSERGSMASCSWAFRQSFTAWMAMAVARHFHDSFLSIHASNLGLDRIKKRVLGLLFSIKSLENPLVDRPLRHDVLDDHGV